MSLETQYAPNITIIVYSHHFACTRMNARGREVVFHFARRFVSWQWKSVRGESVSVPDKIYASAMQDRSVVRFHINALPNFRKLMADMRLSESSVSVVNAREYEPQPYTLHINPQWKDRPIQVPFIEYLSQKEPIAKLLELPTGTGKGYSSMRAMGNIGQRVVAILKPKYMEKWDIELRQIYQGFLDAKGKPVEGKILQISGSKELKLLLLEAAEGRLGYPFILISNVTLRNWITEYERIGDRILEQYACLPEDLFLHLRAGVRLIDEGHEDFHFCFKLDTYTHVPCSITLTATLVHKDPFITSMYELQFPPLQRMEKPNPPKHTDVVNVLYRFKAPEKIRTEERGQSTYSHTAFEDSILKHVPTLRNYTELIGDTLDWAFVKNRVGNEKALVYAATVKMCSHLTEALSKRYPQMDVRRFVGTEKDPYENLMQADITVSTVGRAGTAMDIPNLAVVGMTTALESVQGNIQALGRIRYREGKMLFAFFTAENIDKHVRYAESKERLFSNRVKSFRSTASGHTV